MVLIYGSLIIAAAMPQEEEEMNFCSEVSGCWLKVERHNKHDYGRQEWNPSYVSIESQFRPIAKKLPSGKWEIEFESELQRPF